MGERVEPVLEVLQAASPNRFHGIRHGVTWDPHPEVQSPENERKLPDENYRAGGDVLPGTVQNILLAAKGLGLGSVLTTRHPSYETEINSFWVYQQKWKLWRFCPSVIRQRAFAMALPGKNLAEMAFYDRCGAMQDK